MKRPASTQVSPINPNKKIKVLEDFQLASPVKEPIPPNKPKVLNISAREEVKPKIVKLTPENLKSVQAPKVKPAASTAPKILNGGIAIIKSQGKQNPSPKILNKVKTSIKTEIQAIETGDGTVLKIVEQTSPKVAKEELDPMRYATPVETEVFPCDQCERTFREYTMYFFLINLKSAQQDSNKIPQ
jgi:hypothetical protein